MLRKAGLPGWGAIIPIVNIFFAFYLAGRVSYAFGHGILMVIFGLVIFAPIGYLILGFNRSRYPLRGFGRAVGDNRA